MTTMQNMAGIDGYLRNSATAFSLSGATGLLKASAADTNGGLSLIEITVPPHFRALPPHWHARITEGFYILEGTLAFTIADQTFTVMRGGFVLAPPRTVHQFWNPTAAPATLLNLYTPAQPEAYFADLSTLLTQPGFDLARLLAFGEQYDQFAPPVIP